MGTFSDGDGADACDVCASGTVAPDPGSEVCALCSPGTYDSGGGEVCFDCPAGTFSDTSGADSCAVCAPGTAAAGSGNATCAPCPIGTFADASGQAQCVPCPQGTTNDTMGSTTCDLAACDGNQFDCDPILPWLDVSPVIPGDVATFTVSDVPAGSDVYLAGSIVGPGAGPCHPTLGVCFDIQSLFWLGWGTADSSGSYAKSVTVPSNFVGGLLFAQPWRWMARTPGPPTSCSAWGATPTGICSSTASTTAPTCRTRTRRTSMGDGAGTACDCDDQDPNIQDCP